MNELIIFNAINGNYLETLKEKKDLTNFLIKTLIIDTKNQHNDLIAVDYNLTLLEKILYEDFSIEECIKELESRSFKIINKESE